MQLLCQLDVQGDSIWPDLDQFLSDSGAVTKVTSYARKLARSCRDQAEGIDKQIEAQLQHWTLERLSPAERNVLRVALTELWEGKIPPKVVINEAVEISREFGGKDSPRFVNGVLEPLWKKLEAGFAAESEAESESEPVPDVDSKEGD